MVVGLLLPPPVAGASPRAGGAAALAVDAVVGTELLLEVEGVIAAGVVVVAQDVVGTGDHAAGAPGAQTGVDHLLFELLPLPGPAFGLGRDGLLGGHGGQR